MRWSRFGRQKGPRLKEMGMPMKGTDPKLCLYWFIEAKDPET